MSRTHGDALVGPLTADAGAMVSALCAVVRKWRRGNTKEVKACKRLVQDVAGREITAALRAETARRIADIRASDEGREGVQSFLNKRKPAWLADAG